MKKNWDGRLVLRKRAMMKSIFFNVLLFSAKITSPSSTPSRSKHSISFLLRLMKCDGFIITVHHDAMLEVSYVVGAQWHITWCTNILCNQWLCVSDVTNDPLSYEPSISINEQSELSLRKIQSLFSEFLCFLWIKQSYWLQHVYIT